MAVGQGARTGRSTGAAVLLALLALALPAAAHAAPTPHLDRVEAAMRRVAPDLAGTAYHRTSGNAFVGADGRPDSWILQTPDCWGQRACARPEGIPRFLRTLERDLAGARTVVDLTTLIPFPFGPFRDAIVRGLRRAYAGGQRPVIRVLGGCAPPCAVSLPASPAQAYADQLAGAVGSGARVVVAAYRFPPVGTPATLPSLSFNHSKTIAVDGRVALVGGHNLWGSDYIQGYPRTPLTNPVHDVTLRVEGPVSTGVHKWANTLWRAACATARSTPPTAVNGAAVAYGPGTPRSCPAAIRPPRAPRAGRVDVLGAGRLSLLGVKPPSGPTRPSGRGAPDDPAPCPTGLPFFTPATESPDWTNDRAYWPAFDRRDPAGTGLRSLIRSARSSVFIAQQDLHGLCQPPQPGISPRFDRRLLDVIAGRLLAGVDVRVVISTPGATISEGVSYSNTTTLGQTSSAVLARTRALAGDPVRAARAVERHFRLRSIRFGPSRVWPNAPAQFNRIANHSKLGMVDNCAVWVGSHNLYPFWLSEYTLMSENSQVAGTFKREYADELWRHSARGGPLPGRACARST